MKLPNTSSFTRPLKSVSSLTRRLGRKNDDPKDLQQIEPAQELDPPVVPDRQIPINGSLHRGDESPSDPETQDAPVDRDDQDEDGSGQNDEPKTLVLNAHPPIEPLTSPTELLQSPSSTATDEQFDNSALAAQRRPRPTITEVKSALFGETIAGELIADNISAWFGDHKVLDRVSLDMTAGQVTALIGPSGCGKSTFLRILNRMHEMIPTATLFGEVRLDGNDIYEPSERITAARRQIGMIFQKPNPFPAMSIYENVISGLKLAGIRASRDQKDTLVEESLRKAALWDEVKDRLEQPGGGLSGGQQQRLCIARSLAVSPRVLLMDEPCSALDPTSTRRVEETIESLKGQVTVVIVTHNMQQAARVSSQCAFFLAAQNTPGVIVEYGDTDAMFNNPQDQRTADYVGGRFG
jgi:phosphate transport system ATP-binding protein